MKMNLSARQLSLPLQSDDPVAVPVGTKRELEQVLADLLLAAAGADREGDEGELP